VYVASESLYYSAQTYASVTRRSRYGGRKRLANHHETSAHSTQHPPAICLPTMAVAAAAAVIAALSPPSLEEMLLISTAQLAQLHTALQAATGDTMLPSFIFQHPTGQEAGVSIALDLGGSTFRVAVIRLVPGRGHGHEYLAREAWDVGDDVKSLPSARFFDWIAERIAEVLEGVEDEARPELVGITWSFPIV
jgi:hexokinase